jgi:two-component system chemotaxis response regulator CheB
METKEELINATCPECRGPLRQVRHENLYEYRCLVGHVYSPSSVLRAHTEAEERALWSAVVALQEATDLVRVAGAQLSPEVAERLQRQAKKKREQADEIRDIIERLEPFDLV